MQTLYRLLPILLLLCACSTEKRPDERASRDTWFSISINETALKLQLALTKTEQNKGLMYRDKLENDHGMLFLFKQPDKRSFWMRNTQIPLDLAYFDADGTLLEIHPLYPYDENSVYSHSEDILIAVEMNQGWFARNNIKPGAKLDLEALESAVAKRSE